MNPYLVTPSKGQPYRADASGLRALGVPINFTTISALASGARYTGDGFVVSLVRDNWQEAGDPDLAIKRERERRHDPLGDVYG